MTKCRVLFLVSLMVAVGGCDSSCSDNDGLEYAERIQKETLPCVNEEDIRVRLSIIHEKMKEGKYITSADYQRLYCREMLEGLNK